MHYFPFFYFVLKIYLVRNYFTYTPWIYTYVWINIGQRDIFVLDTRNGPKSTRNFVPLLFERPFHSLHPPPPPHFPCSYLPPPLPLFILPLSSKSVLIRIHYIFTGGRFHSKGLQRKSPNYHYPALCASADTSLERGNVRFEVWQWIQFPLCTQ